MLIDLHVHSFVPHFGLSVSPDSVLTFLVKRYANDGVKRNDAVVAPLRLDVLPYIDENSSVANDPADGAYVLRAQILHKGAESQDGRSSFSINFLCCPFNVC